MYDVVAALEGTIAPMECFVHDTMQRVVCSHQPDAGPRAVRDQAPVDARAGGIIRSLQTTTLAELVEFSRARPSASRRFRRPRARSHPQYPNF